MRRRSFLALASAVPSEAQTISPSSPIDEPHFPSRQYCFVWRNWELANIERLGHVLGTEDTKVEAIGLSMGLPRKIRLTEDQLRRIYITVIRQN